MTKNERAARAFAAQFSPPLTVAKTDAVNNVPVQDGWVCAYWDAKRSLGVTTICHSGTVRAYLEAAGKSDIAEDAGRAIAQALGLYNERDNGGRDQKRSPRKRRT